MTTQPEETYLGDGLYASFDGFMIMLRAPRLGSDHHVGLEPAVFGELLNYAMKVGMLKYEISGGGGGP